MLVEGKLRMLMNVMTKRYEFIEMRGNAFSRGIKPVAGSGGNIHETGSSGPCGLVYRLIYRRRITAFAERKPQMIA